MTKVENSPTGDFSDYAGVINEGNQKTELEIGDEEHPPERFRYSPNVNATLIQCDLALWRHNTADEFGFSGEKIFFYKGELVVLRCVDGEITLTCLTRGELRSRLSKSVWMKPDSQGKTVLVDTLPNDLLESVLAAGKETLTHIPELNGLYSGCLLTPDGDVITAKGFHKESGYYLTTGYPKLEIPDHPTQEDIKEVKDELWTIFHEFPFADAVNEPEEERENSVDYQNTILALALTIFRPTWKYGAFPMWIVDKTQPGSGATLLQSTVCRLGTGHPPTPNTAPENDGEFEKLYQTILKEGRDFVLIDNLTNDSKWVCPTILTAASGTGEAAFRGYHTQNLVKVKNRSFFTLNGIHVEIREDICRRVFVTRLNPKKSWQDMAGDYTRTRHDLEEYAIRLHPRAVRGMAVLYRSWMDAGEPAPPDAAGNISEYPEMYRKVVGMLYYAGYTNVLRNIGETQTQDDDSIEEVISFLQLIDMVFPKGFTPKDMRTKLMEEAAARKRGEPLSTGFMDYAPDKLREAAVRGTLSAETVGHWLKTLCGRKSPGYGKHLDRAGKSGREGRHYYLRENEVQNSLL